MPDAQPTPQISVDFGDVVAGRAYLRIPFVGKLLLAHWAGAPWSDKNEDACLHALQVEVLAHREREKIVHGASRLGKSVLGGCDLISATMLPGRKVAVVADRYDHVAHEFQYLYKGMRTLFAGYPQAFKRLFFKNQIQYHEYDCDTTWGTRAIGISVQSDEGAQLLGRELTDVVCGEGSHIPPEIFNTKLLRALDGATMKRTHGANPEVGSLSIYTTPRGYEGCSASEWERIKKLTKMQPELLHYGRVPWAQSVWIREASILENPDYSREVFASRQATLDKRAFAEQYLGKMTFASGRVYRSFDETVHIRPLPPRDEIKRMRLALGIDTGAYTGFALVGLTRDNKKWILGEVYAEKPPGGIYTAMQWCEEMLVEVLGPVFGTENPAELLNLLYLVSIDPASQHKPEILDRWDIGLTSPGTVDQKSLQLTLDRVEKMFQDDALFVSDTCVNTLDQLRKYVWKQTKVNSLHAGGTIVKEPQKGYDHLLDAFRFALIPLVDSGLPDDEVPVLNWADAWQAQQRDRLFGPLRAALADGARREAQLK